MRRKEVLYAVIGGVVGTVLTMAVGALAPLGAQDEPKDLNVGRSPAGNWTCLMPRGISVRG